MKIYSIMLCKDEADIIGPVLEDATRWSEKIFVFDNGSQDDTWNIVNRLAEKYPGQIVPFTQDGRPYRIGLRALVFNEVKHEMTQDDWWCIRMDADEFYIDNPKDFLSQVPKKYKQVSKASFDYVLCHEDLKEFHFEGNFEADKDKIRYYKPQTWAETRFVRHSERLSWDIDQKKPQPCGMTFPGQIRVKHYQFRSPQQMEQRYKVRQESRKNGCGSFHHENGTSWQDYLQSREGLFFDAQDGILPTQGNRNKVRRMHQELMKGLLTFFNYYG